MKNKVLVIGSANMDIIFECDKLPKKQETIRANNVQHICGGKGLNQATRIAEQDIDVKLLIKIGDDFNGKEIYNNIFNSKIKEKNILISKQQHSGLSSIVYNSDGNNTIIYLPGSNYDLTPHEVNQTLINSNDYNFVLTQLEIPLETINTILKVSKKYNKTTILNATPARDIDEKIFKYIDYLILNKNDIEIMTNIKIGNNTDDLKLAIDILYDKGVKNLILLDDGNNIYWKYSKSINSIKNNQTHVKNLILSNDGFISGFVAGLCKKETFEQSILSGKKYSDNSVQ